MKKVIIAEGILDTDESGSTIFMRGGITLYPARSSEEIFNLHGVKRADLIISDDSLPMMGGERLCSAIRSDEALRDVSIIMVCDSDQAHREACRSAGANAVIQRPIDPFELFTRVSELLIVPQRKEMRVLLRVSVEGRDGKDSFFAASQNISISGMLLESDRVLEPGRRLTCAFNIGHSPVQADCLIIRTEQAPSGRHRYGVKFNNLDTKALIVIEQFVKSRTKR